MAAGFFAGVSAARADVFYLVSGAIVEGDLAEERGDRLRILLDGEAVTLLKTDVRQRDAAPTTRQRYQAERAKHADTAQDEYELGVWCDDRGMADEARAHYRAAVTREPTLTAAWQALGYVPVGDAWLDARPCATRPATHPSPGADRDPLLREILRGWSRRIHQIRRKSFDANVSAGAPPTSQRVDAGRAEVLAIRDPLAIPALVQILSASGPQARLAMVGALGRIPADEATANLIAIALLDPLPAVRRAAGNELTRLDDSRIAAELRHWLACNDEIIIRRAAVAIGQMRLSAATGDLIPQLVGTRAPDTVSRDAVARRLERQFAKPTTVMLGGRRFTHAPTVSLCDRFIPAPPAPATTTGPRGEPIRRPEVLDALIAITGENLEYDVHAWRQWYARTRGAAEPRR